VPIKQPPEIVAHQIRLTRTVLVLNLVLQFGDVAAPDGLDWHSPKHRIDQPLKRAAARPDAAERSALALEIVFSNAPQCSRCRPRLGTFLRQAIDAPGNVTDELLRLALCGAERQRSLECLAWAAASTDATLRDV
jgi:hypothetical protein